MFPIIILGVVVALALGAKGGGGGPLLTGDTPIGGGGTKPSGGTKPGGGNKGNGGKGDPNKGKKWGAGVVPDWFDWEANSFWISPDCDAVYEGALFLPQTTSINSAEGTSLQETLNGTEYGTKNSVYGFVDYLIDYEGFEDPEEIALRVMMEANALCADLGPDNWEPALADWFESFASRISEHVYESTGGIAFG